MFHRISAIDKTAIAAMRAIVEPNKASLRGTAARVPFDGIMEHVAIPEGVTFEAGTVEGVSGWWSKPTNAQPNAVILHIHGGWFNWGSAKAYRNLVGHLASHAWPHLRLHRIIVSPRNIPFLPPLRTCAPAMPAWLSLTTRRSPSPATPQVGPWPLGLLLALKAPQVNNHVVPVAGVALSPVTDLSLSGASWTTRAAADPYFVQSQAAELVRSYLNGADPNDPAASPLRADLTGLPPIRIHVGDDEVLLDDSVRFVERAFAAGVDGQLDVWEGMVHGFPGFVGQLSASTQALEQIGSFLSECCSNSTEKRQSYRTTNGDSDEDGN